MRHLSIIIITLLFGSLNLNAQISAFYTNNRVEIAWSHSDIKNINYFVIEKSKNGKYFKPFLTVPATEKSYSTFLEMDFKPYKHITYYRIRFVNNTGNYYYSETITAKNHIRNISNTELTEYDKINVLVVLKNLNGTDFYAKLNIKENNGELVSETLNEKLKTGRYLIIASEDDTLLGANLKIINRNVSQGRDGINELSDTLNIK